MSKFQKRHYEAIARVLTSEDFGPKHVKAFALMFQHDNSAFDESRFIDACCPLPK